MDRAPRARGRASAHLGRGRPRPRDHGDRGPRRQVGRAGAAVREPEGLAPSAPHQPVRHRAAHVPRARRRDARRRRGEARRHPRHAAAAGAAREGQGAAEAEVGRGLAAEDGLERRLPGGLLRGRRRRPRAAAGPALLAGRSGAVHHAPRGHHEGPEDGRPQRRHVPDAGDRPQLDLHALADAQGRAGGSARVRGRAHPRRGRDRARPGHGVLRERAAPEAPRRAHARRLPARRAGRARPLQDRRPRGARERGDRPRGPRLEGRRRASRARSATTPATTRTPSRSRSSGSRP